MWREARVEDYPEIIFCHRDLEALAGETLDLPAFDHPAVLQWLVAERDGKIVQFAYVEKLVEMKMGGCDKEAMRSMVHTMGPQILVATRAAKIRWLHVTVPPKFVRTIARHLKRAGVPKSPNILFSADLR